MRRDALVYGLLAWLIACTAAIPALADDDEGAGEDVDYVALAARLVQDGHYDRAEVTLSEVDPSEGDVDLELYYVLRGLIFLEKKLYQDAAGSFERAIRAGKTDPLVYINLARARFGASDFRGVVRALDRAGPAARAEPQAELLKSRAHWELSEPDAALEVLGRAGERFPDVLALSRNEIFYLIELGLFQELARRSEALLRREDIEADDVAAIGEALRHSGQRDAAKRLLEAARLRFPGSVRLTVQLSRVFMDAGEHLSSAILLERAARRDPSFLVEAAELYRRAGRLERALFINARIRDQKKKIKQRLQILLELERYEMVAGMEARLSRLGLLSDQQIRYALAYGYFEIHDFGAAERHLARLTDADLFRKAIALRKAIETCRAAGWLCQ